MCTNTTASLPHMHYIWIIIHIELIFVRIDLFPVALHIHQDPAILSGVIQSFFQISDR